jgi:putative ABC transport system substrate-binding protein
MISRRRFLSAASISILATSRAAEAQPARRVWRLGVLDVVSMASNAANLEAFRQGLRELGYVEGQDFVIEYRSADGQAERFPGLVTELLRLNVDVIVTRGTPAVSAAKQKTTTTPIVMASSGDPVGSGVVASLARPGGNVTGLSALATEIQDKQLEVLKEVRPGIARVGFLFNMANPVMHPQWKEAETAARSLRIQPVLLDVRNRDDLPHLFDRGIKERVQGLVVGLDALTAASARRIVQLSAHHRLPSVYPSRDFIEVGGLVAYGASYTASYRRAATFVDKILKGAKPADLPVEQPTKFELVINMRAAKALGLTIPPALRLRADQIIE